MDIHRLTAIHGESFVDECYRCLLGRTPGPQERARWLEQVQSGRSKVVVAGAIRYSAEGRRRRARVTGLWPRLLAEALCEVPAIGAVAEWLVALAGLGRARRHARRLEEFAARQSDEQARALSDLAQRLTTLATSVQGLDSRLAEQVVPELARAAEAVAALQDDSRRIRERLQWLASQQRADGVELHSAIAGVRDDVGRIAQAAAAHGDAGDASERGKREPE